MSAQSFEGGRQLMRSCTRNRIVERENKSRLRGGIEPALDQSPRLEIVRERERAEIMSKGSADARGDRKHCGDARHDGDVEGPPGFRSGFDLRAHRGRHGKHAGIAARDDGDACALRGMA